MQHLRITATLDPTLIPPIYSMVDESETMVEARVIDWNLAADDVGTFLYAIDGDAVIFREGALETSGIDSVALSRTEQATSYALISARPAAIPIFTTFMSMTARAGLVVRKPLVYRNHRSHAHVVGEPGPLQATVDETPRGIDIEIEQIGQFPSTAEDRSIGLSDRQRETIETALAMGYYDQPRKATHADIAAELECASNTVTVHLQKGEAKLIHAAMDSG
jgi:predicted DNA binding protein